MPSSWSNIRCNLPNIRCNLPNWYNSCRTLRGGWLVVVWMEIFIHYLFEISVISKFKLVNKSLLYSHVYVCWTKLCRRCCENNKLQTHKVFTLRISYYMNISSRQFTIHKVQDFEFELIPVQLTAVYRQFVISSYSNCLLSNLLSQNMNIT